MKPRNYFYTLAGDFLEIRGEVSGEHINNRDLGINLINLVNLDGQTNIRISPAFLAETINSSIKSIDITGSWRKWVKETFGKSVCLTNTADENNKTLRGLVIDKHTEELLDRKTVGINFGGYYMRIILLNHNQIIYGPSKRIEPQQIQKMSPKGLCKFISSSIKDIFPDYNSIGFAWAAPRGYRGIMVESHILFENNLELQNFFKKKKFQNCLQESLGCQVSFWNDGEAIALADWVNNRRKTRNSMSLKLGTSVACGAIIDNKLCLHPLELAKCIISNNPFYYHYQTIHPDIFIHGTLREAVGAGCVATRYFGDIKFRERFIEFQRSVEARERRALLEFDNMVEAIRQSILLLNRIFKINDMRFFLGGKTLEGEFGNIFMLHLQKRIGEHNEEISVESSKFDDHCAAIGAALLGNLFR